MLPEDPPEKAAWTDIFDFFALARPNGSPSSPARLPGRLGELPGRSPGSPGSFLGPPGRPLGVSSGASRRLLRAFEATKSGSAAESLVFLESSSRVHGSIDSEGRRRQKWAPNRSLGDKRTSEEARRPQRASKVPIGSSKVLIPGRFPASLGSFPGPPGRPLGTSLGALGRLLGAAR